MGHRWVAHLGRAGEGDGREPRADRASGCAARRAGARRRSLPARARRAARRRGRHGVDTVPAARPSRRPGDRGRRRARPRPRDAGAPGCGRASGGDHRRAGRITIEAANPAISERGAPTRSCTSTATTWKKTSRAVRRMGRRELALGDHHRFDGLGSRGRVARRGAPGSRPDRRRGRPRSDDGRLVAWKPAFGGQLVAAIGATSPIQMATVRAGMITAPLREPAIPASAFSVPR